MDSKSLGNIQIKTNEERRAYFNGDSYGGIILGGGLGVTNSATVPFTNPLIIVDSIKTLNSIIASPTIQLSLEPRARATNTSPVSGSFLKYNGGSDIVGSYLPLTAKGAVNSTYPFEVENEGALHLRGGVAPKVSVAGGFTINGTLNPGSVWMYPQEPTNTAGFKASDGHWQYGNVRLWSTPDPRKPSIGQGSSGIGDGLSLGLDANLISTQGSGIAANQNSPVTGAPVYKPVVGRVSMYGRSTFGLPAEYSTSAGVTGSDRDLNQNQIVAGLSGSTSSNTVYASVNVGDQYRSTQSFKVFGDIVGEQFAGGDFSNNLAPGTRQDGTPMSVGGGIISGLPSNSFFQGNRPDAIQMQSIMSGSTFIKGTAGGNTGWSAYIPNKGSAGKTGSNFDADVEFAYSYT